MEHDNYSYFAFLCTCQSPYGFSLVLMDMGIYNDVFMHVHASQLHTHAWISLYWKPALSSRMSQLFSLSQIRNQNGASIRMWAPESGISHQILIEMYQTFRKILINILEIILSKIFNHDIHIDFVQTSKAS